MQRCGDGAPRPVHTSGHLAASCAGDPLALWMAQDFAAGRTRAWTHHGAVLVARSAMPQGDRLAVHGGVAPLRALVPWARDALGDGYRLVGDASVVEGLPTLDVVERFTWMDVTPDRFVDAGPDPRRCRVGWLRPAEHPQVEALLRVAFPSSRARPRAPGVRRWAGLRGAGGDLVAVAADAWSCPRVGFVSGVATHPGSRGRGLGTAVSRFLVRAMLAEHPRVGLYVDVDNTAAEATYRSLGMTPRPLALARFLA